MSHYDLVIIGAGPSGLALAQCCSSLNKRILVIDRESDVGGCHRVRRVPVKYNNKTEMLFTEHGPRVYSSTYKTFIDLLHDLDLSFYDFFTPYNFTISSIGGEAVWSILSTYELIQFAIAFVTLLVNETSSKSTSVKTFMISKGFQNKSMDAIDRICRLTDGASSENYTLFEFLQLFNQHFFYKIYQPTQPNDTGLFNIWKQRLIRRGVDFKFNTKITSIQLKDNLIDNIKTENDEKISGDCFVIATPPSNLVELLDSNKTIQQSFGDFNTLKKWANDTRYIEYISATFHWDVELNLSKIWGFPKTEWGVAFVVLSDYIKFQEPCSKTVISLAVTIHDVKSSRLNKLPDDCTESELLEEMMYQLKASFPNIPNPTFSLMSPGVYFDKGVGKWISTDTAFITTTQQPFLKSQSNIFKNFYTLGVHNGHHKYPFTSLEAAVSNGVALSYELYPELQSKYTIKSITTFLDFLTILIVILAIYIYYNYNKNKDVFGRYKK
jgi:hypothetical protein